MKHKAKKSLGQNFLTSEHTVEEIVRAGNVTSEDTILEIGPGKGALTRELLKTGAKVVAVEKDDKLFVHLNEIFANEIQNGRLEIHNDDIIDFQKEFRLGKFKLIANIPYNITGLIIRTFLERAEKPDCMVLMVQYEVAKRITEQNESSLLSLSINAYGKPKFIKKVSAGSFFPKPKVDSAVILISDISADFFKEKNISEKHFFEVLHAGFAHKRKKLISNLKSAIPNTLWLKKFNGLNLNENTRAEDISLDIWGRLSQE